MMKVQNVHAYLKAKVHDEKSMLIWCHRMFVRTLVMWHAQAT